MRASSPITLGTSRETSAFVCDTIALAWQEDRAEHYPHVQEVLLTFDAGGANAARSLRFKGDLVALSRRLGLRLRVAHYPRRTPPSGIRSSTVYFVMSSVA